MEAIAFSLFLSCNQVNSVLNRLDSVAKLTTIQKREIAEELRKVVPNCSLKFQNYELQNRKTSQSFRFDDVRPSDNSL